MLNMIGHICLASLLQILTIWEGMMQVFSDCASGREFSYSPTKYSAWGGNHPESALLNLFRSMISMKSRMVDDKFIPKQIAG